MAGEELDRLTCEWWDIFECYPAQAKFVNGSNRVNQLFLGGRGTGKSHALCLKALWLALRNGGQMVGETIHHTPGALMGRTAKEIEDKLEPIFLEHVARFKEVTGINLIKSYSGKHARYTLVNGSQIYKISYGRADSLRKARGYTFAWACIDEIEHAEVYSKSAFEVISACLRHPLAKEQVLAVATTPDGLRGVTAHFAKMLRQGHADYYAQTATVFDNPFVDDTFRDRLRDGCSARMWKQEGLGQILRPSEVIFTAYDTTKHLVTIDWDPSWPIVVGVDWGESHGYICALQVDHRTGTWYVMKEEKMEDGSRPEFRRVVERMLKSLPRDPYMIAADRAVRSENNWLRGTWSDRTEGGVRTVKSRDMQRVGWGIGAMSYMLDPGEGRAPRLYFSDALSQSLERAGRGIRGAMINYRYRRQRGPDGEYTVTNVPEANTPNTHPVDALRYAITCGAFDELLHGGAPLSYAVAHNDSGKTG